MKITITGMNFSPQTVTLVKVSWGWDGVSVFATVVNSTSVTAVLPFISAGLAGQRLSVQTSGGGGYSSNSGYVIYADPVPVLYSVSGCLQNTLNSTSQCDGGLRITVSGINFGVDPVAYVGISGDTWCTNASTIVPTKQFTCQLPYLPVSQAATTFAVTVVGNGVTGVGSANVTYRSQVPVILAVKGCSDDIVSTNATTACVAGQRITILGTRFVAPSSRVLLYVGTSVIYLTPVVQSAAVITCTLPSINPAYSDTPLPVAVHSSGLNSIAKPFVTYAPAPYISAVSGCATSKIDNSTAECNGGGQVTVRGKGFTSTNLQVLVGGRSAAGTTFINSGTVRAQLPYLSATSPDGTLYTVQVICSGLYSNTPLLVNYTDQRPVVTAVSGCAHTIGNRTIDCQPNTTISVIGKQFLGPQYVTVSQALCHSVTVWSPTQLTCKLPLVQSRYLNGTQWLTVSNSDSDLQSAAAYLLSYQNIRPVITSVRGCSQSASGDTYYCNPNDEIWISGGDLPTDSTASVSLGGRYVSRGVSYSSGLMSVQLPLVGVSGGTYDMRVISNYTLYPSNNVSITYIPQYPFLSSVTGCGGISSDPHGGTYNCQFGSRITVFGSMFTAAVSVRVNNVAIVPTVLSDKTLTCTLPTPLPWLHRPLVISCGVRRWRCTQ